MDRETKSFTTPGNHTVVLRSYLTGKESRALNEIMYSTLKINPSDISEATNGKLSLGEIPMTFMIPQQEKMLSFLVVSVDGDTNAPIGKLEELPESEYNAVLAECAKIRVPLVPAK
jgi:hypothetical protein